MKITRCAVCRAKGPMKVMDSFVERGLVQGGHASLPDIDVDYASDRRQEMKEYLEERYNVGGRQRVFSAGTFTTLKLKAALKDVARVHRVPLAEVNYLTAILDDNLDWTGLFRLAAVNRRVRKFILDYPQVIEDVRGILGQPKAASIHASAIIVTPETKDGCPADCFDFLPIRKMDGLLVSEFDGYAVDEIGLLKEDVLATKELAKLSATVSLVNAHYGCQLTIERITQQELEDEKTYRLLAEGNTQNVFQFSSPGITRFLQDVKPASIEDLIAVNALYRPATLDIGATEDFIRYRRDELAPVYNHGCFEATKDTYGILVFQEQFMSIAHTLGGFDLGKTDLLRKAIGKKKAELMATLKADFIAGAVANGCPDYEVEEIWHKIEAAGAYGFNKCISGKEAIFRPMSVRWRPTIGEMYHIMNDRTFAIRTGHKALHEKYRSKGYGMAFSLNEDKRLVKNRIIDIRYMGVRPLYRITLENGGTLDVTANHKHPTQRGTIRTDKLVPYKDSMYVNAGYEKQDSTYRFTDKGMPNGWYHSNYEVVNYEINSSKGHCGFTPRPSSEYVRREYYRKHLMQDHCEKCGSSGKRLEIHHRNGNHATCGENFDNLITLCVSCHKKEHYTMGRTKMGEKGLLARLERIVSVESIGEDEVYDVEMETPYHTFVTEQGMVTCNSHAAAYALTAYCGAWLKANYPSAFYTVALQWADDKQIALLMGEMEACSTARIVPPDVNRSGVEFFTDYASNQIFWSLTRIRQLGVATAEYIVAERERGGAFASVEDFIRRIFNSRLHKRLGGPEESARVPVNARHMKHMILAGCFDKTEGIKSMPERLSVLRRAGDMLGFTLDEKEFPASLVDKHYFWSQRQIAVSGIGSIDYRRIYDNAEARAQFKGRTAYLTLREAADSGNEGRRVVVCATVADIAEASYTDKTSGERVRFAKLRLQQNNDTLELVCWNDFYMAHHTEITGLRDKVVILSAMVRYSDYTGQNCLHTTKSSFLSSL